MRNFGGILVLVGALGFFYCSAQLSNLEPVPADKTLRESLQTAAGLYDVGRYAAATAGVVGLLLALFPKGR